MKMTEQQFREWIAGATFTAEQHLDAETQVDKEVDTDEDGRPVLVTMTCGYAWVEGRTALSEGGEVAITHQTGVEWMGTPQVRYKGEYRAYDVESIEDWLMEGPIELVDDDGDALTPSERYRVLADALNAAKNFPAIDYEGLIPAVKIDTIEEDAMTDTNIITLTRDGEPDLRFAGYLVAEATSYDPIKKPGRWTELALYRTAGGKFVAQTIGRTRWQNETNRYDAVVCDDEAAVIAAFGQGRIAKELYAKARIENVQDVE